MYEVIVKKCEDSNKFRPAASTFEQFGYYTAAPVGTTAYKKYWDEELSRCIWGYTAPDGDYITGYFYFYLNYSRIIKTEERVVTDPHGKSRRISRRIESFPNFYDYDRAYFDVIEEAENKGKHLVTIKKRGAGYSYKAASMLCRNFYCIPRSKSYAMASEAEFLTKDGLLTKAWDMMSFIDTKTAWGKRRQVKNTAMHKRASFILKSGDDFGITSEGGWGSEIIGVSLKNDPQKVRGKRGKLMVWEEAGKFPGLKESWQIARPSVEDGSVAFGLMIAYGTGGTEGADYEGLKDLFYAPESFNALPIRNIWDDGAYDGKPCGFFVPEYYNLVGSDEDGNLFMDSNGNSNIEIARKWSMSQREKIIENAVDKTSIDRYIAEHPFTPIEATLQISGNIFPKKELISHLASIRNSSKLKDFKQVGDLYVDKDGKVKWEINTRYKDLTKWRLTSLDDPSGAIVIWEHPPEEIPYGLYIIGCLLPGEKVITDKGLVNVEDVNDGYKLVDKDGNNVDISTFYKHYKENEDVYKLKVSNIHRTTTFTKEHPIYVSSHKRSSKNIIDESEFDFDFKKVSELKVGDWIKYPNYYFNDETEESFASIYDYWWFQGLWLGDGWCSNDRVYVCFDKTNTKQLERYTTFVNTYKLGDIYTKERKGSIECSFFNKEFSEYLTNTYGRYSYGKSIPESIKHEKDLIKQQLLLGFLDSDGCVCMDKKRGYISLNFVSTNLKLLEDFQDIGFSLGLVGNMCKLRGEGIYNIEGRKGVQKDAYQLRFGHNDSVTFSKKCGFDERSKLSKIDKNNVKITRSRPKTGCFISKDNKYIYLQIKDISKDLYTGYVYNFETTTHTYCAKYITTHNCDSYDYDQSTTDSLGSAIVFKRFQNFEAYYDLPVAEYTGRPEKAEMFYEKVRLLALYYNARVMYENQNKGIFDYFLHKKCDYLLADQPDIIRDVVGTTTVKRIKGCHMTKPLKTWGIGLLKDWLCEEFAPGRKNLTKIFSEALLEELISYNDQGNFDRVMAMVQIMIYLRELHSIVVKRHKEIEKRTLFKDGIFRDI